MQPVKRFSVIEQVESQIRGLIKSGQYSPGDKLPTEKELCQRLNVGRGTVREAFRLLEAQVLRKTVEKYAESTAVLALGGGAVLAPASAALLHEKTVCIYLRATLDTLLARLSGETAGRPLADEAMASRLAEREPIYEKTAHVTIDTDGLSPDEVADEIIISAL